MKRFLKLAVIVVGLLLIPLCSQAAQYEPGYYFGAYSDNGTSIIDLGYEFKGKVLFEYDLFIPADIENSNNAIVFGGESMISNWGRVGAAMYINGDWAGSEDVFYTQDATGNGVGKVANSNLTWKNAEETPSLKGYTKYHVEQTIDTTAKIENGYGQYEIYITPEGGEREMITINGYHGFRTSYDNISKFGVWSNNGVGIKVKNLCTKWIEGDTKLVTVNYIIGNEVVETHQFLRGVGESFICPAEYEIEYNGKKYALASKVEERIVNSLSEDVEINLYYDSDLGISITEDYKIECNTTIRNKMAYATYRIIPQTEKKEHLNAIIVLYKDDGTVCDVQIKDIELGEKDALKTVNLNIDICDEDEVLSVMLWNEKFQPLVYKQQSIDIEAENADKFTHPGLLHTEEDLARISEAVKEGMQPYLDGWNALKQHWLSKPTDISLAKETIDRTSGGGNFIHLGRDMARAYQCALRWKIEGNEECAETAVMLLNDWSAKLKSITGNDRFLVAGLYGYQLANAAELMRDYPTFEVEQMQNMLLEVFVPLCEDFLERHNGAYITEYWANWDLCNIAALASIGVFCDRQDIYDRAIEYYRYGDGNGAIYNAIPHLFENGLAQNQESGRDQGHNTLSICMLGVICETAWNQGDDLYSWADNRLMYAAEYVARYNNGYDVPFELYEWGGYNGANQSQTVISASGRGAVRPVWELLYNHYANRMGYSVPNIREAVERNQPESGSTGNFDIAGFGTLLFTREMGTGTMATPLEDNLIEDGVYRIIVKRTQKALTADDDGVTQKSVGNEGQEWIISSLGSGQYTIINAASGLSLGSEDGSYDPKTEMVVSEYTGANSQKFTILPTSEEGYYRITPIHTSKALDVLDNSNQDGAKIIQWRYLYNSNQQWRLESVD